MLSWLRLRATGYGLLATGYGYGLLATGYWLLARLSSAAALFWLQPRAYSLVAAFQWSYRLSVYSALQYGHFAHPVFSIGRYTRGCEFQRCMPGMGQDRGKSDSVTVY
jgi:hypothetical protein